MPLADDAPLWAGSHIRAWRKQAGARCSDGDCQGLAGLFKHLSRFPRSLSRTKNAQRWAARSRDGQSGSGASSAWFRRQGLAGVSLPESPVSRHEGFQHVRDQRHGIDRLAIGLRVQRRVAVEVGFQAGWAREGQLRDFLARQRAKPQFPGRAHREVPLLKNSG